MIGNDTHMIGKTLHLWYNLIFLTKENPQLTLHYTENLFCLVF